MRAQLFLFIGLMICIIGGTYFLWTENQEKATYRIPTDGENSLQATSVPTPNDVVPSLSSTETPQTAESSASDKTDAHTNTSTQYTSSMQSYTQ